jgi:4-hydroxybenzoyl-CoA reductase subunit beta
MKKDGEICWVAPSSPRCWAVQSSDSAPVMVAIGAKVKLVSPAGERVITAAELYNDDGIQHLNKRPDEMLTEIQLPATNGWKATYWKLRRRGSFDFPVLGVSVCMSQASDGTVKAVKIILGGVGSYPIQADASEKAVLGKKLTEDTVREAAEAAFRPAKPLDNTDFHMLWRKEMTRYYVAGALREVGGLPAVNPPVVSGNGSGGLNVLP